MNNEENEQTFTITRVVEFNGIESNDIGITIEFYGPNGPLQTITMDTVYASALRIALEKAGV